MYLGPGVRVRPAPLLVVNVEGGDAPVGGGASDGEGDVVVVARVGGRLGQVDQVAGSRHLRVRVRVGG